MKLLGFSLSVILLAGNSFSESTFGVQWSAARKTASSFGMLAAGFYHGLQNRYALDPLARILQTLKGSDRKRARSEKIEASNTAEPGDNQGSETPAGSSSSGGLGGAGGHGGEGQDPNEPRKTLGARVDVSAEDFLRALQRLLQEMRTAQNLTLEQANQFVVRAENLHQEYFDAMRRMWGFYLFPRFLAAGPRHANALLAEARAIRDRLPSVPTVDLTGTTPRSRGTRTEADARAMTPGAEQGNQLAQVIAASPRFRSHLTTQADQALTEIRTILQRIPNTAEFDGLNEQLTNVVGRIRDLESTQGEHYTNLFVLIQALRDELYRVRGLGGTEGTIAAQAIEVFPNAGQLLDLGSVPPEHPNAGTLLNLDSDDEDAEPSKLHSKSGRSSKKGRSGRK